MSSISKMQILGIRSFSPEKEEIIEFYAPLTMIVGENGCGKTTLIECLKFACTGALPPGVKGGQSFVNDPAMTDNTEVKAQIKLLFKNRKNVDYLVSRSLQVTKKKTKLEYKALDSTIRTTDENGQKVSMTLKCSDIDRIVPENLGVSSAILENVIFVHQEDSNWPMQEGSVLKTRFDDVFESTRYTKALDALLKTKKELQSKTKDIKIDLAEFGAQLNSAKESKQELDDCEEKIELCRSEILNIQDRLSKVNQRWDQSNKTLENARKMVGERQKWDWKKTENERRIQDKTKNIEKVLVESDESLRLTIDNFEAAVESKKREMGKIQKEIESVTKEIYQIRSQSSELSLLKGQATALQDRVDEIKRQQMETIANFAGKYSLISTNKGQWSPLIIQETKGKLDQELRKLKSEQESIVNNMKESVSTYERSYKEVQTKLQGIEIELKLKSDEYKNWQMEYDSKRIEYAKASSSRSLIESCQSEYESALKIHDDFNESYQNKCNDFKRLIKETTDQIRELQDEIQQNSRLLEEMNLHRTQIALLDAQMKQIDSELNAALKDIQDLFTSYRGIIPPHTSIPTVAKEVELLASKINSQYKEKQESLATSRNDLLKAKSDYAGNEALINQHQRDLQILLPQIQQFESKQHEIQLIIQKLNEIRQSNILAESGFDYIQPNCSLEELLQAAKLTEDEARELLVIAKSGKVFLKRLKKMRTQNPNECPCCGQEMRSASVTEQYDNRVQSIFSFGDEAKQGTVEDHKAILAACSEIHAQLQTTYSFLLTLQKANGNYQTLEDTMKKLTNSRQGLQQTVSQAERETSEIEGTVLDYQKFLHNLNDLNLKWANIEQRKQDISERKRKQMGNVISSDFSSGTMGSQSLSLDELEAKIRQQNDDKERLQLKKDKLIQDEGLLMKRFFSIKSALSEKETALSSAKLEGSKATEIESAINTLQQKMKEWEEKKSNYLRDQQSLTRESLEKHRAYQEKQSELQFTQEKYQKQTKTLIDDQEILTKSYQSYLETESKFNALDLPRIIEQLQKATDSITNKENQIKTLQPSLNIFAQEISQQERTKRNILENLELRMLKNDNQTFLQEYEVYLRDLENLSMQRMDIKQLEKENQQIAREKQTITSEKDTLSGKLLIYQQQINDLNKKLKSSTYNDIEEKHRRKNIDFETTNLAIVDLDNYYKALDRALQSFHTLKIREINKIIRELWLLVYQGKDIDAIEIESGSDLADTTAKVRSYNYRVVMKKGDVPLDMRGRCSAGQKVLAAIVIRLALAETFCLNCGILALDEPTTNLDDANKLGLATALARLIISRSKQQNFQLICITHDEEFVQMIRNELSYSGESYLPEYYFRVFRDDERNTGKYFSHLERIPWEDM